MATTNQTATTNLQNDRNNANQWYNHLAAALMMGRANPQTMLGYLIGNKLLKQPFEKWVAQIQGRVPDQQTQTSTTFQDALKNAAQNNPMTMADVTNMAQNGVSNQQLADRNLPDTSQFKFNPELMKEDEIQKLFGLSGGLLR